jgi:hypothetical protein
VVGVEKPSILVDQALVIVVAECHNTVANHMIEHDQRDEPREVRRGVVELGWDNQRAREKRRPMRVR